MATKLFTRSLAIAALCAGLILVASLSVTAPVHAQVACPAQCPGSCNPSTGACPVGTSPSGGTTGGGVNTTYLAGYKTGILYVINSILVPVLISIAFLVFLWGVAQSYIISGASEDARERGHQLVLWGVIGFVIIFSVWGIVNIVGATLGLSAGGTAAGSGLTPPTL